ncbi:MAG: hypothetical protein LBR93_08510 [Treponema sp.]|jgi:hypothetical protein|nr:hypothetical protein [Treponema sp.]
MRSPCSFTMNGGTINDNISGPATIGGGGSGGGVLVNGYGSFTMNGGTIRDNKGGPVKYDGVPTPGKLIVDGVITISSGGGGTGGGVHVKNNGSFTMNGGKIGWKNFADTGGGVYVGETGSFIMTGGALEYNKALAGSNFWSYKPENFIKIGGDILGY